MDARRLQILSGARECFAEYGFEGATVRRLEEAAGMSRGASCHRVVQVMREILADPQEFSWLGTRLEIARRIRTDPEFRERWTDRQAEVDAAIVARLREQKASGRMRTDIPADVLRVYLDIILDGLITHLATGRGTEHVSEMLDLVEASLRTGQG